jgi:DNA-binding CsgD family transcriptional regulator
MNQDEPDPGPALLEREYETGVIVAALRRLVEGSGAMIVVEGVSGIGKSALVAAACDLARQSGYTVLRARGTELETAFPLGVVRQLLEPPVVAAGPQEQADLLADAASASGPLLLGKAIGATAFDPTGVRLLHSLWWLTFNLASHKPVLLTIDDAQWADPASVRYLAYLGNRLESLPALVLLTVRSGEPVPEQLGELSSAPGTRVLRLRPLSDSATRQLVRSRISGAAEAGFCAACHEATQGNPLLLNELLRGLLERQVVPDETGVQQLLEIGTTSVAPSVLRRVERLGPPSMQLARALALWGGRAELRQAAAVAGLAEADAGVAADKLAAADIVRSGRPLEFVHPLVRAAIYSDLTPSSQAGGHRQVADQLEQEAAPAELVAAHLLYTEPSGDSSVVRSLLAGAEAALGRGSPEIAKHYLGRALREPPEGTDHANVLSKLGVAEMRFDPRAALVHLSEALERSTDDYERGEISLELIRAHLYAGSVSEAEKAVVPVIRNLVKVDQDLALQLDAELIVALRQGRALAPFADSRLDQWSGRIDGSTPAERLILSQLAVRSALSGAPATEVVEMADSALGDGLLLVDQSPDSLAAYLPLYPLLCADQFSTVERYLDLALKLARERGSPSAFALAFSFKANLSMTLGELKSAESESSEAAQIMTSFGLDFMPIGSIEAWLESLILSDRLQEAEQLLADKNLLGPVADTVPGRIFRASRGRLRIAQGRTEEGLAELLDLERTEKRKGLSNLYLTPYRPWAALAQAQMGDQDRAVETITEALAAARNWGSARILSLTLTMAGRVLEGDAPVELFREAAEVAGASPARLAEASALVELGSALRRAGKRSEAVDVLRRALDLGHRCGAEGLAQRARSELVMLGARPRRRALSGAESLTAGERRVADLAASGLTNRQIAEDLFLTTRTVEHHLTHAYQKLGISSRSQLEQALKPRRTSGSISHYNR